MTKNFFHISKFNFKEFLKLLPNQKNKILDYGCGNGMYNKNYTSNNKISKIYMYDKNKTLKKFIKKKYYNNHLFQWIDNLNVNYNIVLINSVVQYMDTTELKKKINFFFKIKHVNKIIVSDLPKYNRIIEAFLLILFNPSRFFKSMGYLFNKNYLKEKYYYKNIKELKHVFNDYKIKKHLNLNDEKILRYTLIIQKKKW